VLSTLQSHAHLGVLVKRYATMFWKCVVDAKPPLHPYPTDLEVPQGDYCNMVALLEPDVRSFIGQLSLAALRSAWSWRSITVSEDRNERLKLDVDAGRCSLVTFPDMGVELVVPRVELEVTRQDALVLAELGVWDNGLHHPDCRLPGAERQGGETVMDATQRVLTDQLPLMQEGLTILGSTETVEVDDTHPHSVMYGGIATRTITCRVSCGVDPEQGWLVDSTTRRVVPTLRTDAHMPEAEDVFVMRTSAGDVCFAWVTPQKLQALSASHAYHEGKFKAWCASLVAAAASPDEDRGQRILGNMVGDCFREAMPETGATSTCAAVDDVDVHLSRGQCDQDEALEGDATVTTSSVKSQSIV